MDAAFDRRHDQAHRQKRQQGKEGQERRVRIVVDRQLTVRHYLTAQGRVLEHPLVLVHRHDENPGGAEGGVKRAQQVRKFSQN
jgi:hypothetical protein